MERDNKTTEGSDMKDQKAKKRYEAVKKKARKDVNNSDGGETMRRKLGALFLPPLK